MRWLRRSLFGIFLFYPLHWGADFVLDALPALARVVLVGHRLKSFDMSLLSVAAASRSAEGAAEPEGGNWWIVLRSHADWLLLILAATAVLFALKRHRSLLACLGLAALAHRAFVVVLFSAHYGRDLSAAGIVIAGLYFCAFCMGLRWVATASGERFFRLRLLHVLVLFGLPLTLFYLVLTLAFSGGIGLRFTLWVAPALVGSVLASLWPAPPDAHSSTPRAPRWKAVGVTAIVLLLFTSGVYGGSRAVSRARERANRAALESLPALPADAPYPKLFFHKGVNFTAEYPDVYGSEGAREMLKKLPEYGVNAIALVPYGFASRRTPRVRGWNTRWESDDGVRQLARLAHALGMKVLLKPQLWPDTGNPADLGFATEADRAEWFAQYQRFLEHYARLAAEIHADVLCIGVELEKMTGYEAEWRRLTARVRELYPGPLTYAANAGPEFERIAFWDALDYIGLDEYYPLPDDLSTDGVLRRVEAVHERFGRPVLFTEAGFASLAQANRQPWHDSGRSIDLDLQARGYEAIFRAFYSKPWFAGVYWWKIGTNGYGGTRDTTHTPWGKPAMDVLRRWYLDSPR